MTDSQSPAPARTEKMRAGRQAGSARRRQRVITAISQASSNGTEIGVAGIARAAGVDRTFLYRHRDLLGKIHALEAAPPAAGQAAGPAVTRASLQAGLLAAHERAARLNAQVRQLENACPRHSANKPGASPASTRPQTSARSTTRSASSNSRPPTCGSSSANATTSSPPPAPPTASS